MLSQMSKIDTHNQRKGALGVFSNSLFEGLKTRIPTICPFTVYTEGIEAFGDYRRGKQPVPDESHAVGKIANNTDADRGFFERKWGCFSRDGKIGGF